MSNQSVTIKFTDIVKTATARIDSLCLVRGAYIDGSLKADGFSFSVDVSDTNKADILKLIGKEDLLHDSVGFQSLCVGSAFRPVGSPEMKKIDSAQALESLEKGIAGTIYDWEAEELSVICRHEFNRDDGYFWGQVFLTVNEQFKINIDFELNPEGDLVPKFDFNGLTAVDVTTKVVRLSHRSAAILITTFAGGKSVENAFCC